MTPVWTNPDGSRFYVPDTTEVNGTEPTPDAVRQFMREIGRRGGLERSRGYARRSPRCRARFMRRYRCDPNRTKAATITATLDQWHYLREFASRGGRARARKHSREQLRAWAAKGGVIKAAKSRERLPQRSV